MKPVAHRAWGVVATVVVTAAVAYGFWIVGSPESRRLEKMDDQRLGDLQAIVWEMRELVYDPSDKVMKRPLFDDLAALKAAARVRRLRIVDPATGEPYGYRKLDEHRFELCAGFVGARDKDWDVFWNHGPGRQCFIIDMRDRP